MGPSTVSPGVAGTGGIGTVMGEHIEQRGIQRPRTAQKNPRRQTAKTIGRRLLEIVVYDKCCRIGGKVTYPGRSCRDIGDR